MYEHIRIPTKAIPTPTTRDKEMVRFSRYARDAYAFAHTHARTHARTHDALLDTSLTSNVISVTTRPTNCSTPYSSP